MNDKDPCVFDVIRDFWTHPADIVEAAAGAVAFIVLIFLLSRC